MLKVGDELDLSKKRVGEKNGRDWMFVNVLNENGKSDMCVWARNASEARNFTSAKIKEIIDVSVRKRKSEQGVWFTDVNVTCILEGTDSNSGVKGEAFDNFMKFVSNDSEEGLPFN